jgi:hypothetical protein
VGGRGYNGYNEWDCSMMMMDWWNYAYTPKLTYTPYFLLLARADAGSWKPNIIFWTW